MRIFLPFTDKFQQFHVSNRQQMIQEPTSYNLNSKPRPRAPNEHQECQDQEDDQVDDYNEEDEEKTSYTSSTTPRSRCSRGVSTDELEDQEPKNPNPSPIPNPNMQSSSCSNNNNTSKRIEDGDPAASEPSRNSSLLLQIISCGNIAVAKAKRMPSFKQSAANINNNNVVAVKKRDLSDNLHKGVVCRSAVKVAEEEDDNMIINYMPENPRFGNFQSEEKEYFSGSIVESTASKDQVEIQPVLKKSNSYNEERLVFFLCYFYYQLLYNRIQW